AAGRARAGGRSCARGPRHQVAVTTPRRRLGVNELVMVVDGRSRFCWRSGKEGGLLCGICFFFSSRRRHTRLQGDWSSDVCSSDLEVPAPKTRIALKDPRRPKVRSSAKQTSVPSPEASSLVKPTILFADQSVNIVS